MNNSVFRKTMKNVQKQREINSQQYEKRKYFVSEPDYHTKSFSQKIIGYKNEKNSYSQE